MLLTVYVPAPDSPFSALVWAGSAIVGRQPHGGQVEVYYEGARDGRAPHLHARLELAAGRLLERYPTVARALVPAQELVAVGAYDPDWRRLTVTSPDVLAAWCGVARDELEAQLGDPRPPAAVDRDHPEYLPRLSARIEQGAPLSGSELHDAVTRIVHLSPGAQRLLTGAR